MASLFSLARARIRQGDRRGIAAGHCRRPQRRNGRWT
ncbi:hypothetical protein E1A91_A11G163100v1 [Gossypium mustelinum]|uniref:Uncharacterized protein n=2 Tax=Gossypium TaxID=3633 RepID=A0A5J5TNK3_GOSBA|nr:hypothetical protein ES319_A11G160100v1 [Gossypium barbadense]TYJ09780.1 hypothetical protein E1A91_A11G163100v1 [Gossypium mustelinum]